jgi:hypothetical protein
MKVAEVLSVGILVVGLGLASCGGGSKPTTPQCTLNSDCAKLSTPGLVCALGYCVTPCKVSSDCPNSERCVLVSSASSDGGTAASGPAGTDGGVEGTACQAPETVSCQYNSQCKPPLVCGDDHQCRDQCEATVDCPLLQVCTSITHLCADPTLDKDYSAAINDFVVDGGVGGSGGSTAAGGRGGSSGSGGASGGSSGKGGGASTDASVDKPGAKPDAATGPLGFAPSNFDPTAVTLPDASAPGIDWNEAPAAMISTICTNCLPTPSVTITMNDGTLADLYVLKSLIIGSTAGLTLGGPRPIILAVLTTVDIQGLLAVNASAYNPGPGGFSMTVPGPGAGVPGGSGAYVGGGAGGGSYCGVGGHGSPPGAPGGRVYGTPELVPLLGGSAGGGTNIEGAGGGAIQIIAGTSITVRTVGAINAGGGTCGNTDQGGGSGGAILLEAPTVSVMGVLAANGGSGGPSGTDATAGNQPAMSVGGGNGSAGATINGSDAVVVSNVSGGGGGGAGRIRINSATGSATIATSAVLSPDLTTACATQGQI